MTIADQARNLAISLEAKKDALAQRQSGDWKISFTVQGIDMDARLAKAAMGTRYAMVLVEIGDDEQPVLQPTGKETHEHPNAAPQAMSRPGSDKPPAATKREWRDLRPAQQAGMRCEEPAFIAFLKEERAADWRESADDPAACIRLICGVSSRAYIEKDHRSLVIWKQLDDQYRAWKAVENA